ncbi:hypothetical protein [Chengkuizengella marina]|uniref:Uncharacterized protein n=1 Tax=Chengkuizengella marina TaxID=2507566 RepID=A0A6N9Q7F3_9BACL|nr:hypothetical protein [Chengkuizengella marina]NBI30631.1 hypothetical protein [Chengkuizengella marina]
MSDKVLNLILNKLDSLESESKAIRNEMNEMRAEFRTETELIRNEMNEMRSDISEIKQSIHRLEESQPKDIFALLKNISIKVDYCDHQIGVLNKRLFKAESHIEELFKTYK